MPGDAGTQTAMGLFALSLLLQLGQILLAGRKNAVETGRLGNTAIENDQRRVIRLEVQREEDRKKIEVLENKLDLFSTEKTEDRREIARQGALILDLLQQVAELKVQLAKYQDVS